MRLPGPPFTPGNRYYNSPKAGIECEKTTMMLATNLIRLLILATLISFLPAGVSRAAREAVAPADAGIKVSFKLDPRLTQSMYMGERWVSPPTYTGVRDGKEITVDARAEVISASGKSTGIGPKWIPSDPEMVTVTPGQGNEVKITVLRAGQSSLKVTAPGLSRELSIKATLQGSSIQVNITQNQ